MRLYSTPESVRAGEVTVLAIVETVIAVTIAIYIASRRNTLMHIAIAASIAPFLLLRTNDAVEMGIKWFGKMDQLRETWSLENAYNNFPVNFPQTVWIIHPLAILIFMIISYIGLVSTFMIRIISIIITSTRHPLESFKEIPKNWFRIVVAMDMLYPPEIIAGAELSGLSEYDRWKWSRFISDEIADKKAIFRGITISQKFQGYKKFLIVLLVVVLAIMFAFSMLVLISIYYIPSLIFRFSLKSTSLIYLPIIWIIRSNTLTDAST